MNIIVFDTETIGKKTQSLLNVGYRVLDFNSATAEIKTLVERSYLDRALYADRLFMLNDDFVGEKKLTSYDNLVNGGGIVLRSMKQALTTMYNDMTRHNVLFGYAYNCDFDIDKISKTCAELEIDNPLSLCPIYDIWAYACDKICNSETYFKWARENNIYTATKKIIATSVEAVTKFLNNDLEFVEEHTALSDTEWEIKILQECVRRGSDITKKIPRKSYFKSGYIFHKEMILPSGEVVYFDYTDVREDKDGVKTYQY